jgi:hypothetical protein
MFKATTRRRGAHLLETPLTVPTISVMPGSGVGGGQRHYARRGEGVQLRRAKETCA